MSATVAAAGHPVQRGTVPKTAAMEVLQVGYLHAVAAAAGCTLSAPNPDRGIDWIVSHEGNHTSDPEPSVKIQLKCTSQTAPNPQGAQFSFSIENAHLKKLAASPVTITRLLVVMLAPSKIEDWVLSKVDRLEIRHRCYWVNLEGVQPTGSATTTVYIPTANVFDDVALCDIMCQVGAGVRLR